MDPGDPTRSAVAVPNSVLRAFGVEEAPSPLPGGQGEAWRAGDVVLKPDDGQLHEWWAAVCDEVRPAGVRLARPLRTSGGAWTCVGWSASRWVVGTEVTGSSSAAWLAVIEAGRSFHRALRRLGRPAWLDERSDWWALGDRVACGERRTVFHPAFGDLPQRLQSALRPLGTSQIVHLDLTGNVLLEPGQPPAIIDITPYWRSPEYADGVVVADAMCWHGAQPSLAEEAGVPISEVARALLFRLATTNERLVSGEPVGDVSDEARRYGLAAEALGI